MEARQGVGRKTGTLHLFQAVWGYNSDISPLQGVVDVLRNGFYATQLEALQALYMYVLGPDPHYDEVASTRTVAKCRYLLASNKGSPPITA